MEFRVIPVNPGSKSGTGAGILDFLKPLDSRLSWMPLVTDAACGAVRGSDDPSEVFRISLVVMSSRRMIPPEVIVPNRIKDSPVPLKVNHGRDSRFFFAFMKESIHGHHPPKEEAMLFHSLKAIGRTGGKARASVPIDRGNMFSVKIHQPKGRIEAAGLIMGGGWLSRGFAVRTEDQKPKNKKEKGQAFCRSHGHIPDTSRSFG